MAEHSVADTPSPQPSPEGRGSNSVARFNRLAKIFGLVFLFITIVLSASIPQYNSSKKTP